MKEIKFRLIKNNKIVGFEKHKLLTDSITKKSNVYIYHSRTGHELSWYEITMCPKEYIAHDDKNQFTGLHDKNSKEIYGGDILHPQSTNPLTEEPFEMIGEVYWDSDRWNIKNSRITRNDLMYRMTDDAKKSRIIGNVYENKELLNDTTSH